MNRIWIRLCNLIFDFICFWCVSFPWKRFAFGTPFLCVVIFLAASGYLMEASNSGVREYLLQRQLTNALAADDWETARVVLQRRLRMFPADREAKFQLARAMDALGERDHAEHLMRQLTFGEAAAESDAPDETSTDSTDAERQQNRARGADPRAGQWLLENVYLSRAWEELSDRDRQDLLSLLEWLHDSSPDRVPLKHLYAEHLMKAERYHEALSVLVTLIPEEPKFGFQAALIARMLGEQVRASSYAEQSLTYFTTLLQQNPSNAALAVALARCQVFLNQHSKAVETLEAALQRSPQQAQRHMLRQVLAGALLAWATALEGVVEQTPEQRLQRLRNLQRALQYAPNDEQVIQAVAQQVLAAADSDGNAPQVEHLRESLIDGTSPGIAHFIRGTAAIIAGDDESGKFHLGVAARTLPNSDAILNNLAYVMARQADADLEHALRISQTAISQASPPTSYHLETRGQILFKLGRFAEAIPDLEAGLSVPDLETAAHRSLAECYRQLGEHDLSEQHQLAAETGEAHSSTSRSAAE